MIVILLFIQGGSRWKFDEEGNIYTDSNFNEHIWDRYRQYCDKLVVVLRREPGIYKKEVAKKMFNRFDTDKSKCVSLPDAYRPIKNALNIRIRNTIECVIREEIEKADMVIIRSIGTIYTNTALKWVRKLNKPYMVEETGFSFEALWYHSFYGKFVALQNELLTKHLMKDVPRAVYVTNEALQKRYPCKGKSIGCSDVEIIIDENAIIKRRQKIKEQKDKIILGTAAFLDVGWKGQKYVIRAISELKNEGIDCFEYQLIGSGKGKELRKEINRLGLDKEVKIVGALPHEKVYDWLDSIDVYVQSSFMEGLCRSIIEAMSRACPVVCSNVGGNYELIDDKCMFKKGRVSEIKEILFFIQNKSMQLYQAERNFKKAHSYTSEILDKRRNKFYKEFMEGQSI